jgi:hypothetical protein|tara:strand:+ start:557 stop:679 length:123 start_codon:yes stop_codon:yes gene_type:complete
VNNDEFRDISGLGMGQGVIAGIDYYYFVVVSQASLDLHAV